VDPAPNLTDFDVHERAQAAVRERFAGQPGFVWDVKVDLCREGLIVQGRASRAALELYYSLVPPERWFIMHVTEVADPPHPAPSD
jgi:hypothetical protein